MKDETKHRVANSIYNNSIKLKNGVKRELKFIWKPLLLGLVIVIIFLTIAEWSDVLFGHNNEEFWGTLGIILGCVPLLYKYYKRLKLWVIKWK